MSMWARAVWLCCQCGRPVVWLGRCGAILWSHRSLVLSVVTSVSALTVLAAIPVVLLVLLPLATLRAATDSVAAFYRAAAPRLATGLVAACTRCVHRWCTHAAGHIIVSEAAPMEASLWWLLSFLPAASVPGSAQCEKWAEWSGRVSAAVSTRVAAAHSAGSAAILQHCNPPLHFVRRHLQRLRLIPTPPSPAAAAQARWQARADAHAAAQAAVQARAKAQTLADNEVRLLEAAAEERETRRMQVMVAAARADIYQCGWRVNRCNLLLPSFVYSFAFSAGYECPGKAAVPAPSR
jgi:hypothetical protein